MKLPLVFLVLPAVIYAAPIVNKFKEIAGAATGKTDKETQATLSEYYNEKERVLQKNNGLYTLFQGLEQQCNEECIPKGKKLTFPKVKYEKCAADCKLKKAYEIGGGKAPTKGQKKPANKKQEESLDNEVTSHS